MINIELEKTMEHKGPDFIKEFNGITYVATAHFKEFGGETMDEKIKRILQNEILYAEYKSN